MCLILFSYNEHPGYKLILAANRDEFLDRPAEPAHWWKDHPDLLAGKDLKKNGLWLGMTRAGKFSVVTNFRKLPQTKKYSTSRGELTLNYLLSKESRIEYLEKIKTGSAEYDGYNLLFGNGEGLSYYSNRGGEKADLKPGLYGLSNHLLDTPWPKVEKGKKALAEIISENTGINIDRLVEIMRDKTPARDEDLPHTGLPLRFERLTSPAFVEAPGYGTRNTTILLIDRNGRVHFYERSYFPEAVNEFRFEIGKD